MTPWLWLAVALGSLVAVWAVLVAVLVAAGRRADARAAVRFVPDCLILIRRLLADPRVPRRRKLLLLGLAAYLAMPFDLVPDFVPVAGHLDDVLVVVLVLRTLVRSGGEDLVREHWPGTPSSLEVVLRATGR